MFNAIDGMYLGQALGIIEQEKRRQRRAQEPSTTKMRIKDANTIKPGVCVKTTGEYQRLPYAQRMKVIDYLDELKQQAKWDAEKCANQQSKNI